MLALNNQSFLHEFNLLHKIERDMRLASHKSNVRDVQPVNQKKKTRYDRYVKTPMNRISTISSLYIKSFKLLNRIKKLTENDYKIFLSSDDRTKEDIYIKWEIAGKESAHFLALDKSKSVFFRSSFNNLILFSNVIKSFEEKLKLELYGNVNLNIQPEHLKELEKRFAHLPKQMLEDDSVDDKYSEVYL